MERDGGGKNQTEKEKERRERKKKEKETFLQIVKLRRDIKAQRQNKKKNLNFY